MSKLDGKVAVITGGASGIGEATVKLFVDEGARVVIADIQDEPGQELARSLGEAAIYQHTDVTSEDGIQGAVGRAVADFGHLDIMFNNAGGLRARGSILEISTEAFDAALALLLRSVFLGMKQAGIVMAAQGSGTILSTSSVAGISPGRGPHVYATAKAAVIHLTKSVALELGEHKVRVNCICPGGVATPLVCDAAGVGLEAMPAILEGLSHNQPLARACLPEDIAGAALWLCSDAADYITGQSLTIDGGEALGPRWFEQKLT